MAPETEPLRLAIVWNGRNISGWARQTLQRLQGDARFKIVCAISSHLDADSSVTRVPSQTLGQTFWRLVDTIDRAYSSRFRRRHVRDVGYDVEARHPLKGILTDLNDVEYLTPTQAERLKDYELDVILAFESAPGLVAVSNFARFGGWELEFAGSGFGSRPSVGFSEWFHKAGDTKVRLQILTGGAGAWVTAREASYRTFFLSWNENRRRVLAASSLFMTDGLSRLANERELPRLSFSTGEFHAQRPVSLSSALVSLSALAKLFWRAGAHLTTKLGYREKWHLLAHEGPRGGKPFERFAKLSPPRGRIWADPFLLTRDNRHYIFFEDLGYVEGKGKISVAELKGGRAIGYRQIVDTPYHLSFPFVFEFEGKTYLIPESHQNKSIEVWRCTEFPYSWERHAVLMDGVSAVDTVLFEHDGIWWMFTTLNRILDHGVTELHLFYADHPLSGAWQRHPQNPIVTDARTGRMGGRVSRTADGNIIRCAQDNRFRYGNGIVFCEVTCLSRTQYRESVVEEIRPTWEPGIVGTHHFDSDGSSTVIDVRSWVPRYRA